MYPIPDEIMGIAGMYRNRKVRGGMGFPHARVINLHLDPDSLLYFYF